MAEPSLALWGWLMTLSKVVELGDTIFIVLRKSQLSFLHWYHHITVLVYTWYAITPRPSALSIWFSSMNYTVHTIMYTYYALRASGYKIFSRVAKVRGTCSACTSTELCVCLWLCVCVSGYVCVLVGMYAC